MSYVNRKTLKSKLMLLIIPAKLMTYGNQKKIFRFVVMSVLCTLIIALSFVFFTAALEENVSQGGISILVDDIM